MEKFKKLLILLIALLGIYYMYLTHVSQVYYIDGTYLASDEYSKIILDFDGETLSTYLVNPNTDVIAIRTDYQVGYRKYNEDILGNFWSNEGIEPLGLRGSDLAGRMYGTCIGCAIWPIEGDMEYFDREAIIEMEKNENTNYSFVSHFATKNEVLRVYDYTAIDLEKCESVPTVEAEIIRLLDSLCPPVIP